VAQPLRLDGKDILTPATADQSTRIKGFNSRPLLLFHFVHSFNILFGPLNDFAHCHHRAITASNTSIINVALALISQWRVELPTSGYDTLCSSKKDEDIDK
jgi:hypothetical protein